MSLEKWKANSKRRQEGFAASLGDRVWELYRLPQEKLQLWQKIATALYGNPKKNADDFGLLQEEKKIVCEIQDKCIEYSKRQFNDAYLAVIFTCVYKEGKIDTIVPVFRVRWEKGQTRNVFNSYFIDHIGRVYNTWVNYLEENIWDVCWICVPEAGIYLGNRHDCARFYNQTSRGDVVEVLDKGKSILGISSSIGLLAGIGMTFFPPTAAIGAITMLSSTVAGTPGAVYGTGRSVAKILDRVQHDQSVGLRSSEARMCWLNVLASTVSFAGIGATKVLSYASQMGITVSEELGIVCTGLGVASISTSGLGVLNFAIELNKRKEVTALDALQFTTSIFFLTHSIVTFKTASDIIKESKGTHIEKRADTHDKFHKGKQGVAEHGKVHARHGNTEFIKTIRKIDDAQEFLSAFRVTVDGSFKANEKLLINSRSFCHVTQQERSQIIELSERLKLGEITLDVYNKGVKGICKEFKVASENYCAEDGDSTNKALHVGLSEKLMLNIRNIFDKTQPHETDHLERMLESSCENHDKADMEFGTEFAKTLKCQNVSEFCAAVKYGMKTINEMATEMQSSCPKEDAPQEVKANNYFKEKILKDFRKEPQKFEELLGSFRQQCALHAETNPVSLKQKVIGEIRENLKALNAVSETFSQFKALCHDTTAASSSWLRNMLAIDAEHSDNQNHETEREGDINFTAGRYLEIVRDMTSADVVDSRWKKKGTRLSCKFNCQERGLLRVRFDNLTDGSTVIATLIVKDEMPVSRLYNS